MFLYRSSDFANIPCAILVWWTVERVCPPPARMRHVPRIDAAPVVAELQLKQIPARLSQTWGL